MTPRTLAFAAATLLSTGLLSGCNTDDDITADAGIATVRTACPTVGIPAATGDVTLFDPATSRDATAIDLTAMMTNVRSTCGDAVDDIVTNVTFDVQATRTRTDSARDVTLPYFIAVVRGGTAVTAKRLGQVTLRFAAGERRAQASGAATSVIARSAATLSEDVRKQITAKRKPGDETAAIDPLSLPEVRQAVLRASFEALVGFQLTDEQLKYNATR